jgi:predicted nucleotidyltransferase
MQRNGSTRKKLIASLHERAKELNCLYEIEEAMNRADASLEHVIGAILKAIPPGWQYPEICRATIVYEGRSYASADFKESPWFLGADIVVQDEVVGRIGVTYTEERPVEDEGPFLKEEVRLIRTIADRLGHYILYMRLRYVQRETRDRKADRREPWRGPVHLLRESDRGLYLRVARKMLNHLCRTGHREAQRILSGEAEGEVEVPVGEINLPGRRIAPDKAVLLSDRPFELAAEALGGDGLLLFVQRWMLEDKASVLQKAVDNPRSSLPEIGEALRRYHHAVPDPSVLPRSTRNTLRVSLIRRFLSEQLDYIEVAKEFAETRDFDRLLERLILPADSQGMLGGKSAGILLARWILERSPLSADYKGEIKVPKTWYVASDSLLDFITYNDLEEVIEQKYKDIEEIRHEYPNIVQLFKNSSFPPSFVQSLSLALDDFGEVPLIIRSSSLLEDRLGAAFSGKYKSLFVANVGPKGKRVEALLDAVAEVYASTFGPDPIEYRKERRLLDFHEEMGVLIQEVVGARIGKYFFPAFAGVAFSKNEFRWSPRIRREDGLVRMVPGLGTRAVDRMSDDYPILIAPGKPNLRVNVALDEIIRYAPTKIDLINLEAGRFDTVDLSKLMQECGSSYPGFAEIFSVVEDGLLRRPMGLLLDPGKETLVATFEGLLGSTGFIDRLRKIMDLLAETLKTPVDIEFAHDGKDFYLLQCRPQSYAEDAAPAPIPKDVPPERILFTANRHVSNGWVPDVTHLVYVDPAKYSELGAREDLLAVGRAVGALNKILPKRQFLLMGPGRWGSRGDIKMGVSVTYADINNASMIIEIARSRGDYRPELSFGTHFFQDLVEARIRYLPLYPDDEGIVFQEAFLRSAENLLPELLPKYRRLQETLRVIDVAAARDGQIVQVLMNADLDEALALFTSPDGTLDQPLSGATGVRRTSGDHWRWRLQMAHRIAEEIDAERFGVEGLYLFGSTKNATAGPGSDIDLLVHVRGDARRRKDLMLWLEGWSRCLGEMNYLQTGYRSDGLLDVHVITDEDIAKRTSYASKIGAVTDAARELPLARKPPPA